MLSSQSRSWVVGAFFLCCLFPFVSPVPVETDTQPLFLIFGVIVVARHAWDVGLRANTYWLLGIAGISLGYINPFLEYRVDAGKAVSVVAGVLTYVAATRINHQQAYRLVRQASLVYFIYSCLIYLNPPLFLALQEYFVRGVNVADISNLAYRGAPALATEPGLLGGLLVFLLIQLRYLGKMVNASARQIAAYGVLIVLTIIMTKSGTGYLYLLTFLALIYGRRIVGSRLIRVCLLSAVTFGLALVAPVLADLDLNNRGAEILITLVTGGNLEEDTSVLKRIYDLRIGFESLFDHPFGAGVNGVSAAVNELAIRYDLLRANDMGNQISLVSGLSFYFVAYGLLGLLFIVWVFLFVSRASPLHKAFALIYLLASFSPAFPAIWILLAQTSDKKIAVGSGELRLSTSVGN